ncbi:MAG TPA: gamma-glutamyl-gamma-aminobutyrate hydrolase family protein, partial [Candidatus Syntrophosphaera thermopropionivorans]|nr:gamma-glutamyl-gamma-aminobutyrate hydrolase family protein [Candidatus Syntrophosphaera thermopropionivorans]
MHYDTVLILDFGSQYTQLIGRVIRSFNVYCEIHPYHLTEKRIKQINPKAIILSGSPFSINQEDAPQPDSSIWEMNIPILGICYGMQLIVSHFRGKVQHQTKREYGQAILQIKKSPPLLEGLALEEKVWMS